MTKPEAIARERDLLVIERDLTPEEAAELRSVRAFLALPENDGPLTAAARAALTDLAG